MNLDAKLSAEQIDKFIALHKCCEGFDSYTEEEVKQIANGVANYYLTLFRIQQRINKEANEAGLPL